MRKKPPRTFGSFGPAENAGESWEKDQQNRGKFISIGEAGRRRFVYTLCVSVHKPFSFMPKEESMSQNPYQSFDMYAPSVAELASADVRAAFLRRTYLHLLGALLAFVGLTAFLLNVFNEQVGRFVGTMMGGYNWLFFMGGFMVVSWIADRWAQSNVSRSMQYLGLSVYVIAEVIFFLPLLYLANTVAGGQVITSAGILTGIVFGGLTLTVLVTKSDFSFLKSTLMIGGFVAFGLIACAIFIGFPLGMWFSVAMIVFACGMILYNTSNILHHYNSEQYVAASLALFASVTLLFWYAVRLFMHLEE
jgi:FtsH-binding integral membrane protein